MAIPLQGQKFPARNLYKDFDLNFARHPLTGDLGVKTDAAAVKQALRTLVLTNFYERPFQPEIGSNVTKILFEPADVLTAVDLRQAIYEVIGNNEPRVTLQDVVVSDDRSKNAYNISVVFTLAGLGGSQETTIVLQRLR